MRRLASPAQYSASLDGTGDALEYAIGERDDCNGLLFNAGSGVVCNYQCDRNAHPR